MKALSKRLNKLEDQAQPKRQLITVYKQDGEYWTHRPGAVDYRAAIDPEHPANRKITAAELAELEKTHIVILVRYEKMNPK